MPLYMTLVVGPEGQQPPQEMYDAVERMMEETTKAGVLVEFGGLLPSARGSRAALKDGKVVFTDGPFAESKEVLGGYAVYDCPDLDTVKKWTKKFLDIHHQIWPAFRGTVEIREMIVLEGVRPK